MPATDLHLDTTPEDRSRPDGSPGRLSRLLGRWGAAAAGTVAGAAVLVGSAVVAGPLPAGAAETRPASGSGAGTTTSTGATGTPTGTRARSTTSATSTTSRGDQRASRTARASRLPVRVTPVTNFRYSARYGQRGRLWSSGRHTGLDFAAASGTPVRAAQDGKVVSAGWAGAYGRAIVIKHRNGAQTRYAHLSRIHTKPGKKVKAGQRIGRVGSTGNSTGPHLHFEVIRDGRFRDPHRWLRAGW
ncbi:MAG: M23 family metallopeptidase [Candidatus Nanopelagicales bacterium]